MSAAQRLFVSEKEESDIGHPIGINLSSSVAGRDSITVMLSAAKHLYAHRGSPFAEFTLSKANGLRVTIERCRQGATGGTS